MIIQKIKSFLREPWKLWVKIGEKTALVPAKLYINSLYRLTLGKKMNWKNPQTFNEKLQFLKIYDNNPFYPVIVDKVSVKEYVSKIIGEEHIIPTLGVYEKFSEIDFSALPDKFVLKCTHDSGSTVVCKNKADFDFAGAKTKLDKALRHNFYLNGREKPYKNLKRRIIAEQYLTDDENSDEFTDYKFYCFGGRVDCVMACYERTSSDTKYYFFDKNWKLKRINKRGLAASADFSMPKPKTYDEMISAAQKLSNGFPFVRVDLYESCGKMYFGELTLYPNSGFDPNYLPSTDLYFGSLIDLASFGKRGIV
jgi:hypothetical protein